MKRKAFTLIEILAVITIIVLTVVVIWSANNNEGKTKTIELSGHTYYRVRDWNGETLVWSEPVHDPECRKCKESR